MRYSVRFIAITALIAALYAALTLLIAPASFGMVQLRVSEALTILPVLLSEAVPGLFVGCLVANLVGAGVIWDVVFGSLATLLAAIFTRKLRANPLAASAMPVIFNAAIVGPVVYFCYIMGEDAFSWYMLALCCASVALGELVACCGLGLGLLHALKRAGVDKRL